MSRGSSQLAGLLVENNKKMETSWVPPTLYLNYTEVGNYVITTLVSNAEIVPA